MPASTVDAYLAALPDARRAPLTKLRALIKAKLPPGYVEQIEFGMPSYVVPLARHPDTYNGKPLQLVAFASNASGYSLYLVGVALDQAARAQLEQAARTEGKKLDLGKACLRFKKLDDLPLEAIGEAIAAHTVARFIALHEAGRTSHPAPKRKKTKP